MKHRVDEELPRHLADAYQPEVMTAGARARLKMAVRSATAKPTRSWSSTGRPFGLAAAATAVAMLALVLVQGVWPAAPDETWPATEFQTTWDENVLYGNEWVREPAHWLDADLVPASYDGAFLALEP